MGKRKRKSNQAESQEGPEVDSAEALRREKQKELRQLALKLRAQGKEYNQHKAKAKVYKDINKGVVLPRPSQQKAAVTEEKASSRKPQADFQVAIIPIFWNQNPPQKKMVIAKCKAAQEILLAGGISSHVDDGSHFTPGQKMRHWEEKGVKVRLEVGPKDAEQSQCIIARSQPIAGQVAYKLPGEIGPTLPNAVQQLLAMKDKDVPEGDWTKYEKKGCEGSGVDATEKQDQGQLGTKGPNAKSKKSSDGDTGKSSHKGVHKEDTKAAGKAAHGDADRGEEDLADVTVGLRRDAQHTGDDLDDDFALELDDVSEALTEADRKRMKKTKKKRQLLRDVPEDEAPMKKQASAKKAKVVKF